MNQHPHPHPHQHQHQNGAAARSAHCGAPGVETAPVFTGFPAGLDFGATLARPLHTDIPVLDDIFSELNSDLYPCAHAHAPELLLRSEPIDLADIESILLPPGAEPSHHHRRAKPGHAPFPPAHLQSFSSRLASSLAASHESLPPPHHNPFLHDPGCLGLFTDPAAPSSAAQMIHLQDAAALPQHDGKIHVKVINGHRPRFASSPRSTRVSLATGASTGTGPISIPSISTSTSTSTSINIPSISPSPGTTTKPPSLLAPPANHIRAAPQFSQQRALLPKATAPGPAGVPAYRSFGKKRYVIGPEYADFVCRLQNDIPFDSSEDDEDDTYHRRRLVKRGKPDGMYDGTSVATCAAAGDSSDGDADEEDEDEEFRTDRDTKISAQELLELFEDQCQGLPADAPGLRRPRAAPGRALPTRLPRPLASTPFPVAQRHFDQLQGQIHRHFQFLVQNLALANEIEGGEAVTLVSLKLLVQLHLHLDTTCNLLLQRSASDAGSGGSIDLAQISAAATACDAPGLPRSVRTISCLRHVEPVAGTPPARNPVASRLADLVPLGIAKVSVIAGFLARPGGQRQVLSLAALRADSTLRPRSTCVPLAARIKPHPQLAGSTMQLLSNAFYNIITLFHDYLDARLLERSIDPLVLARFLDLPATHDSLVIGGSEAVPSPPGTQPAPKSAKFSPAEDALLLCGLRRFGCGNWDTVQAHFLPNRSARQLAIRFKNLSSRREPMNPVKAFNEQMMQPLSEIEEDLLYKGVQRFGKEFYLISRHYLPHRPVTILRRMWNSLDQDRRAS